MQAFYRNLKSKGDEGVTPDERENLKNALVDYGHLQSPPAEPSPSSNPSPIAIQTENHEPKLQSQSPLPASVPQTPLIVDGTTLPSPPGPPSVDSSQNYANDVVWDLTNPFEFNYDWNSADFDAIMADATQGFWADFPGEVGFS